MIELKQDLKSFREKYDKDQESRDIEIAKRPTRSELYSSIGVVGALVAIITTMTGG